MLSTLKQQVAPDLCSCLVKTSQDYKASSEEERNTAAEIMSGCFLSCEAMNIVLNVNATVYNRRHFSLLRNTVATSQSRITLCMYLLTATTVFDFPFYLFINTFIFHLLISFLLLLHCLGELLDVLSHQVGLFHGSKMAATRHGREGLKLPVFLFDPQFGCVHQLIGEAGKPSGHINWQPGKRQFYGEQDSAGCLFFKEIMFTCVYGRTDSQTRLERIL